MPPSRCRLATAKIAAVTLLAAPLAFLVVIGMAFLSSPAGTTHAPVWRAATKFSSLPSSGTPVCVEVYAPTYDAWTRRPDRPLGRVFLRRLPGTGRVVALRAEHSAYRIPVAYDASQQCYCSCCWRVSFDLNGREIVDDGNPRTGDEMQAVPVRVAGDKIFVRLEE